MIRVSFPTLGMLTDRQLTRALRRHFSLDTLSGVRRHGELVVVDLPTVGLAEVTVASASAAADLYLSPLGVRYVVEEHRVDAVRLVPHP